MNQPRKHMKIHLTEERLRDILRSVGVTVVTETDTDLLCYCCFHHNVDSPAFNISKKAPYQWKCWNGKCAKKGNIYSLLTQKGYSKNEARKMLLAGLVEITDLEELIRELMAEPEEEENDWIGIDPVKFARDDEEAGFPARSYALGRGISEAAYSYFRLGYSRSKDMLVVPTFNERSELIGVIGRSLASKQYRYSNGLQRGATIWNVNNVASEYDSIILTEGSLDSIYIWQAGWKNVGAILGSAISPSQWKIVRKYFNEIICFFDNDEPGQALAQAIVKDVRDIGVSVVTYPDRLVEYVDKHGETQMRPVKDPGELTPEEISYMIENRTSSIKLLLQGTI